VNGEPVSDLRLDWRLSNNRINVPQVSARWNGSSLMAHATAEIVHPFRFVADMALNNVDLAAVTRTVSRLTPISRQATGQVNLTGRMVGDAASMNYRCDGEVILENVVVDTHSIGNHRLACTLTPTSLHVEKGASQFFGGNVAVTATLRESDSSIRHVSAGFRDVQAASLQGLLGLKVSASGAFDGDVLISDPMIPELMNGRLKVQSRELQVAGVAVESFATTLVAQAGQAVATIDARINGAECKSSLQSKISDLMTVTPETLNELQQLPVFGQVTLKQVSVDRWRRLLSVLPGRVEIPQELNGTLDINLQRDPASAASGFLLTGNAAIRNLLWKRVVVSRNLVASLRITPSAFEVKEIVGTFADGNVAGRGMLSLHRHNDGQFRFSVQRMNMTKLAAPLGRLSARVAGSADVQVEGRLGRQISGRASVSADRASIQGISFTHARLPLDWSVNPSRKEIRISTHAASVDVGGGRIRGQGEARWNGHLDLDLTATAQNVNTRKLMVRGGGADSGTLDGRVHLRTRGANSINDLSGQFQGKLRDAQALKLPVLDQTSRFLGSLSRSTSFKDGTIKGRLANGVVAVEQINLMASNVRMVINGTATLTGHLNLFVSAYTSETGPADRILDFANSPVMLAAPAPVAIVAKINDALKDRTIHVNVGGTIGQPLVRLQPGRQLQQEALRFFVNSSLNYSPIQRVGATR
jgi:hypothetical protein